MAGCTGIEVAAGGTALAQAVEAAPAGARLCLAAGEHAGGLSLPRSITLVGAEGAEKTVLKGDGRGAVLRVDEDGLAIHLEGLTLTGGVADAGGGLSVFGRGKVVVHDCVFTNNRAGMVGGGGLYAREGLLTVLRSTFRDNQGRQGGAVYLDCVVRAELQRCTFQTNEAESGGALRVTEAVELEVKASTFAGNRSTAGQDGTLRASGTRSRAPQVELSHCDVADGGVVNGPEIPAQIRLKNSKVPVSWRSVAGVADHGGNAFRPE
ncbi:MAG: hypothetical protein ACOYOB_14865 [Myxococcota bacterium]